MPITRLRRWYGDIRVWLLEPIDLPVVVHSHLHGETIAKCSKCIKYLHNRFALRFLSHVVEDHKLDHSIAVDILERVHDARLQTKRKVL
jgi:hypothetical protein